MRYAFIEQERCYYAVELLCRVMRVSRSGFYAWRRRPKSERAKQDEKLTEQITSIYSNSRYTYGAPRIHAELQDQGTRCGKKRVARLMRLAGLRGKSKGAARRSRSKVAAPKANNLLTSFSVSKPNTVWFSDITYLPTREGWLYLAIILDAFSRKVIGWAMKERLTTDLTLDALDMAYRKRKPPPGLVHHSDRGGQYLSSAYQAKLKGMGALPSTSGNCLENAVAESFFATFKTEEVQDQPYETRSQAKLCIFDYLEVFYNRRRRHSSLDFQSPTRFEEQALNLI